MKKTITLKETSSGHWYEIKDDTSNDIIYLPSSTNILSVFPNPGLDIWMQNTTPEAIHKAQEDGKIQGSKTHKLIELQILGQTVLTAGVSEAQISLLGLSDRKLVSYLKEPLTDREEEALKGAENFWEEFKPITVQNELMVYSIKYGFAGTLDWIGYLWDKKTKKYDLWLVDWKISKSLDRSYDLQLASYWKGMEETYHRRLGKIRLGILQLGKNKCNYSFKEIKDKKDAFKLFLKTKDIYDDLYGKNRQPPTITRREEFSLTKYSRKGKIIKFEKAKKIIIN